LVEAQKDSLEEILLAKLALWKSQGLHLGMLLISQETTAL
jgi:hypothetical protein